MSDESREVAKEFLLAEYERFAEAFWKNEQTGETRVNWFIGIVTAALAGLAALLTKADQSVAGPHLRAIMLVGLIVLLVFGLSTFFRMIIRNERTDQYKHALDTIRQKFQDYFAGDEVLLNYYPQGGPWNTRAPRRKLGGLAHNVASINAVVIALAAGVALYGTYEEDQFLLYVSTRYVIPPLAFLIAFGGQYWLARRLEQRAKERIHAHDATHAGGVVFRINQHGGREYLIIHPNKPRTAAEKANNVPREVDVTQRVFPKGHIEIGEAHGDAALREVREEAGVVARIVCPLGMITYDLADPTDKDEKRVKFYLMERVAEKHLEEPLRDPQFLSYAEALEKLSHAETREMLELAERAMSRRQEQVTCDK